MHPELQARTRIVQSPANRWVKALRAAVRRPPGLGERGALVALEGPLLLAEALKSGWTPKAVLLRSGEALPPELPPACEVLELPPSLFDSLAETESPQGISALVSVLSPLPGELPPNALVLVLAGVQDPGNVGTLLRSAEAFGAHAAILLRGTATPWSGKALRASAGSAFRLPLRAATTAGEAAGWLREQGVRSFAAVVKNGETPARLPLCEGTALWIGSEGLGLTPDQLAACEGSITLSMPGPVESLNAAVAGSLLLYEAARQRAAGSRKSDA